MKNFRIHMIWLPLVCSVMLFSCIKDAPSLDGAGQTLVKILTDGADNRGGIGYAFDPSTSDIDMVVTEIRRDANNGAELGKAITVTLTQDDAVRTAYNTAAGKNYIPLPDNFYTVISPGVTKSGTTWTVNFAAGEFAKPIELRIKRSLFSFTNQYAIPLKITDAGAGASINDNLKQAVLGFLAKNKYDARYMMDGVAADAVNPALVCDCPIEAHFITAGADKVNVFFPDYAGASGGIVFPLWTGSGYSYYGSFGMIFTFDQATNVVTSVENYYGQPAGNTRYASIDPSGLNRWYPDTKRALIKWFMHQPNAVATPPNIRTTFDMNFTYLGDR